MDFEHKPESSQNTSDSQTRRLHSPHERVRAHMRVLLGRAALAGAGLSLAGCIGCDPVPPPETIDCSSPEAVAEAADVAALWMEAPEGLVLVLHAETYWTEGLEFTGNPTVQGATITGSTVLVQQMALTLMPDDDATSVTVSIPMSCGGIAKTVTAVLDVSGTRESMAIVEAVVTAE